MGPDSQAAQTILRYKSLKSWKKYKKCNNQTQLPNRCFYHFSHKVCRLADDLVDLTTVTHTISRIPSRPVLDNLQQHRSKQSGSNYQSPFSWIGSTYLVENFRGGSPQTHKIRLWTPTGAAKVFSTHKNRQLNQYFHSMNFSHGIKDSAKEDSML